MIQDLLDLTVIAFMCAVIGFVYTNILTDPGQIFDTLYTCLEIKIKPEHPKLFKVLIECEKCVSGQMALWTLVILWVRDFHHLIGTTGDASHNWKSYVQIFVKLFHPLDLLYTISAAVFIAYLLSKFYTWTKQEGH